MSHLELRERRYRRTPALQCRNADDIRDFVNDVGICLLFPIQKIEMPNIYHAVAGYAKEMTAQHNDPSISLTWNTKDQSLDKRWWYYGKFIRNKATLISLELLPHFYALSENYGGDEDYLQEYKEGKLSTDARAIYESLLRGGAMHAVQLKRASGFYGEEKKGRFDRALTELQVGLKVLPVGIADAGAWHYAFVYELVHRWFNNIPAKAQQISRSTAMRTIIERHLNNVIECTPQEISRLFGWRMNEVEAVYKTINPITN
jgi:hypothetical protein